MGGGTVVVASLVPPDIPLLSPLEMDTRRCSLASPICTVCGTIGARYHYGGLVCRSCRVFFFRHVKNNKQLVCKVGGHCPIILGNSRHACAACRFQKCLDANMDYSIVGRKTKSCPSNFSVDSLEAQGILHPEPVYPSWHVKSSSLELEDAPLQFTTVPTSASFLAPVLPGSSPASFLIDPALWSSTLLAQTFLDGLESYSEIAVMSHEDRKILVDHNCHLFGAFSQKYASWEMKRPWAAPSGPTELLFHSTNITGAEFVILKVICLLSPVLSLLPAGQWQLMLARTRFIQLLLETAGRQNPLWSLEEKWQRVSKLLEIIPILKIEITSTAATSSSQP